MYKLLLIMFYFSSAAFAEEQPMRLNIAGGLSAAYKSIPMPVFRLSIETHDSLFLDGSLGSLLVAGDLNLGARYKVYNGETSRLFVGLKSGLTYSMTDSAYYYAAGFGYQWQQFSLELGPICYYRRDFELYSKRHNEVGAFGAIIYQFGS
jgi:hypothetical protein